MKCYAIPGETQQHICKVKYAPSGAVEMGRTREANEICVATGEGAGVWELDQTQVDYEQRMQELIAIYSTTPLKDLTVGQANTYIDAHWNGIADSRETFKLLVELVIGLRAVLVGLAKITL